jgi:hypothetical protein
LFSDNEGIRKQEIPLWGNSSHSLRSLIHLMAKGQDRKKEKKKPKKDKGDTK